MAEVKTALLTFWRKGEEPGRDVLVASLRWLLQELMDVEVSAQKVPGRYERTGEGTTQRNRYSPTAGVKHIYMSDCLPHVLLSTAWLLLRIRRSATACSRANVINSLPRSSGARPGSRRP